MARCFGGLLAIGLLLTGAAPLWAQLPMPRLHGIFPPGGQRGAAVEVAIQGVDLDPNPDAAQELVFSHPGITAEPKTPPGSFVVKIAGDVPLGIHEVRVRGRYGLSTPRAFAVGNLPEVVEQGSNNALATPMPLELNSVVNGRVAVDTFDVYQFTASAGQRVLLRCAALRLDSRMDATIMLCDTAGNQLAYSRDARRSEPLIDFTAPAEGTYLVQVYDFTYRGGDPYFYRLSLSTQPHLDFLFPPSGVPGTSGKFTLYGRNLPGGTAAEGVSIDGFPLQKLEVEIAIPADPQGPGTPISSSFVAPADTGRRGFEYHLDSDVGPSNSLFISFATATVLPEQEPNDDRNVPQAVTVPCEIAGQFFPGRDHDWFSFQAKKGESFAVEVFSQRRPLPTDPFLLVQHVATSAAGEPTVRDIAQSDDLDPKLTNPPFDAPIHDSAVVFTADADGTYRVMVRDLYSDTLPDPRQVYCLSIGPPKPDFQLLATFKEFGDPDPAKALTAPPVLRRGGRLLTVVQAYRRGGFQGPITVTAADLPAGVVAPPVVIPAGQSQTTLILAAAEDAAAHTGSLRIVGTASINDQPVERDALASTVVWDKNSANETTYARLIHGAKLAVLPDLMPLTVTLGAAPATPATPEAPATSETPPTPEVSSALETAPGSKLSVPVKVVRREGVKGPLTLEARGLPAEIKAAPLTLAPEAAEGTLEITLTAKAPVGELSFYVAGQSQVAYQRSPDAAAKDINVFVQSLPITLRVAAPPAAPPAAK